jgi:hypothetical protein
MNEDTPMVPTGLEDVLEASKQEPKTVLVGNVPASGLTYGGQSLTVVQAAALITAVTYKPDDTPVFARVPRKPPNPEVRCALYGCKNMTRHNGGYCCAAHCREARKRKEN